MEAAATKKQEAEKTPERRPVIKPLKLNSAI